jgi:2'-5' RNA ligase
MKYFIGHLVEKDFANYCNNLSKDISDKFNTFKVYEWVPPHVSFFYQFETENIGIVKEPLKEITQDKKVLGNFHFSRFNHFDDRVIFAKIDTDPIIRDVVFALENKLRKIPNLSNREPREWQPHVTLATRLSGSKFIDVWNYVETLETQNFIFPFDNVTLFCFNENEKWEIEETFRFV